MQKCGIYNSNNQIFCYNHLNKQWKHKTCNAILKSGKNKGKYCGCKKDSSSEKCKRHS